MQINAFHLPPTDLRNPNYLLVLLPPCTLGEYRTRNTPVTFIILCCTSSTNPQDSIDLSVYISWLHFLFSHKINQYCTMVGVPFFHLYTVHVLTTNSHSSSPVLLGSSPPNPTCPHKSLFSTHPTQSRMETPTINLFRFHLFNLEIKIYHGLFSSLGSKPTTTQFPVAPFLLLIMFTHCS